TRAAPPRPQGVARHVLRDVEQPGGEFRPRLVTDARAVQPQDHVLRKVLGLLAGSQPAKEHAKDPRPATANQFRAGPRIATLDLQHERHFRVVMDHPRPGGPRFPLGFHDGRSHGSIPPFRSPQSLSQAAGSWMRKVLPFPSTLSTVIVPPI